MSYNILNKNVNFQGDTQGTIEDMVDTHSTQTINGLKTITNLTGTNVRVTNDLVALSNVSASLNISASAFYANGVLVNPAGGVTINGASVNRLTTVASDTSQLDAEANLTFNSSTKRLQLGNSLVTDTELVIYGDLSGSGNISGSAFYGDGSNLTGVQPTLKSGGGLNYDSNELEVKIDTLGIPIGGIDTTHDRFLIYDNSASALKIVTPTQVGNLNEPVVSLFNGQTQHRVITVGGAEQIDGQQNLTFDGSILTITGDVSGSQIVSGNVGHFVTRVEAGAISIGDATGLAGLGLANASGQLDIQVSGALKLASDKIGISGSLVGNGLIYDGGIDSISKINVRLQNNSGLFVEAAGLKTNFATLTSATPDVAADSIPFIDSAGDAKCSINTFLTQIAGSGISVSGNQLTAAGGGGAVSAVASGADNRIATFSSSDALSGEPSLQFDGTRLSINGAEGDAGVYSKIVIKKVGIADNSATAVVRFTVPNANHAACFKIFGFVTTDSGSRVGTFEQSVAISRITDSVAVAGTASGILSTEANSGGGGADYTIASTVTQNHGSTETNTIDYNLVINTTDSSTTNAVFYVELLNFNSTGITMAAV